MRIECHGTGLHPLPQSYVGLVNRNLRGSSCQNLRGVLWLRSEDEVTRNERTEPLHDTWISKNPCLLPKAIVILRTIPKKFVGLFLLIDVARVVFISCFERPWSALLFFAMDMHDVLDADTVIALEAILIFSLSYIWRMSMLRLTSIAGTSHSCFIMYFSGNTPKETVTFLEAHGPSYIHSTRNFSVDSENTCDRSYTQEEDCTALALPCHVRGDPVCSMYRIYRLWACAIPSLWYHSCPGRDAIGADSTNRSKINEQGTYMKSMGLPLIIGCWQKNSVANYVHFDAARNFPGLVWRPRRRIAEHFSLRASWKHFRNTTLIVRMFVTAYLLLL